MLLLPLLQAVGNAVDGMRVSLGPASVLNYVMQGLWHPARKVRSSSSSNAPWGRTMQELVHACMHVGC